MAIKNYANEHPKYKEVSTRERLQKDWKSYSKLTDLLYFAPPVLQDKPGITTAIRDAEQTRLKERFMYGKPKITKRVQMSSGDRKVIDFIKEKFKKKKES